MPIDANAVVLLAGRLAKLRRPAGSSANGTLRGMTGLPSAELESVVDEDGQDLVAAVVLDGSDLVAWSSPPPSLPVGAGRVRSSRVLDLERRVADEHDEGDR